MRRLLLIWPMIALLALPAWADAKMTVLTDLLKLSEMAQIMNAEDLEYAEELNRDMLEDKGGASWQVQVDGILDPARVLETLRKSLESEMTPELLKQTIAFYTTELGQKIVTLENSARAAISQPDVEEAARAQADRLTRSAGASYLLIRQLVDEGDMIARNVTSALNANYQFMRGMADGGALEMTDEEILKDVSRQTDEISQDAEQWLYAYMLMAYAPLSQDELSQYVAFSETPAGEALNRALFNGFGASYADISYGLGRAVALNVVAKEL